jgi:hypothetical protein
VLCRHGMPSSRVDWMSLPRTIPWPYVPPLRALVCQ